MCGKGLAFQRKNKTNFFVTKNGDFNKMWQKEEMNFTWRWETKELSLIMSKIT